MKKLLFLIVFILVSCNTNTYDDIVADPPEFQLKWNKSHEDDTIEKALIGLQWTLSYLGATLPASGEGISIQSPYISIDLDKLGFNSNASEKLEILHTILK